MLKNVVIIDDDPISILVTETMMKKKEFAEKIISFESPEEALEYFSSHYLEKERIPDYIFLDIQMPTMNGWDFLDMYCTLDDCVKEKKHIIMLSASFDPADLEKSENHELVLELITKPVNGEILARLS